jgi:O-Antigen ligase
MTRDPRPARATARSSGQQRARHRQDQGGSGGSTAVAGVAGGMAARTVPGGMGGTASASAEPWGASASKGLPGVAILFLLSLLPQISFYIGPLLLKPYRIVLLVLFLPLLLRLLSGAAGRLMAIDWLMIGASLWAALALVMNHPVGETIEPIGVVLIEFLGAYMVARVCVRSAEDFRRVVKVLFCIILILLVFAALESLTHRPILQQMLGSSSVDAGVRWGLRRAQAVFDHPIHYGAFVSAALGVVWYSLRPDASMAVRAAFAFIIALSTFFSLSTGAVIAFNMQCMFIAWEIVTAPNPKRWRLFAWGFLAVYVTLDLLSNRTPFHLLVDYASFSSGSAYNRILIWQYGTDNVAENPLFGLGLNDWARPRWMSSSVDNFWLLVTMQYGLPFIAMFGGALYLILRRVSLQKLTDPVDRACRAGYLTTFGGVAIAGGTVHYWQTMFAFVLFVFGLGVWMITGGAKAQAADPGPLDQRDRAGRRAGRGGEASRRQRPIL